MDIRIDIDTIRTVLNMSLEELAQKLNVSFKTIVAWHDGINELTADNMNKLYNFAYSQNYRINEAKEKMFKEEFEQDDDVVLFHGSKCGLTKEVCIENSKSNHDFGKGFYCGQRLIQATSFVSGFPSSNVYVYKFKENSELKKKVFSFDKEWLLLVAYHKGLLTEYENHSLIKALLKKIEDVDYIIAPVTDNRVIDIINDFVHKMINDAQCCHCIAELNLGNQYVFLSNKAIKKLESLDTFFLCEEERKNSVNIRRNQMLNCALKIEESIIKYRGKGKYIDEVFA